MSKYKEGNFKEVVVYECFILVYVPHKHNK